MIKKTVWLILGIVGFQATNEIGFILMNTSGAGINIWKGYLPSFTGALVLGLCLLKGNVFFEYDKKLEIKKLNTIYKFLFLIFILLVLFMAASFFLTNSQKPSNINKSKFQESAADSKVCKDKYIPFYKFKVNVDKNIVISEIYAHNRIKIEIVSSQIYKNCGVVDQFNWVCMDSQEKKYMSDGKFYIEFTDGTMEMCVR